MQNGGTADLTASDDIANMWRRLAIVARLLLGTTAVRASRGARTL